ncbi:MAG: sporulation transcriptional regulator SpoIIID [Lachnospiraceae bacterium]|nr:sporulation transcriptional regulator SpoIIID [Lachnospiraceae bacterium]
MKDYIEERVLTIAAYISENSATVREAAKRYGVSKSTVHKDMVSLLPKLNPSLARDVRRVLDVNKQERHIRGGMATREKYLLVTHHTRAAHPAAERGTSSKNRGDI